MQRKKGGVGAPDDRRLIFFIDDINMCYRDRYGDQGAIELMRQYFDYRGWWDTRHIEFGEKEDIQFVTTLTVFGKPLPSVCLTAHAQRTAATW